MKSHYMTQHMYWPEKKFQHFWRLPIMSVFFLLLLFLYLSFGFRALCKYSEDAHNQDSRIPSL